MKRNPLLVGLSLAALAGLAPAALGQTKSLSVGYVFPAGAQQGTTTEHVIAGQNIREAQGIDVTGGGITAEILEIIRPISGGELNQIRIKVDELMAKRAVARKDDKALENFRSFKNAKDIKTETSKDEIDALKKKYAGATWTAEDEKLVAELRRKMAISVRRPANPAICELVVCRFTVAPDALPNRRELRLRSSQGLSNPMAFYVGQWSEFSEAPSKDIAERKSEIAKTTAGPKRGSKSETPEIQLPCVINGQILPGEIDRWRFSAKKGANLVFSVKARQLIPYISDAVPGWFQATLALKDSNDHELAYRDDFRFDPDPVLHFAAPADGEYYIEIKDSIFRGREDFVYRVTVGDTPFITYVYPLGGQAGTTTPVRVSGWNLESNTLNFSGTNKTAGINQLYALKDGRVSNFVPFDLDTLPECQADTLPKAADGTQTVTPPVIINGRIAKKDEQALFSFQGKAGSPIVAEVMARRLNSPLDSSLSLIGPDGKEVAFNDDNLDRADGLTTHHADSYLFASLPKDGVYRLRLCDQQHRGGMDYVYRLRVSPPRPDFELRAVPSSLNIRAGSNGPMTVHALRRDGFDGEITIRLKDAPEGFSLGIAKIPAKESKAKISLITPYRAISEPFSIELEGSATIDGHEVVRKVVPAEDRMQAFAYRHFVPSEELRVSILGGKSSKDADVKVICDKPLRIPAGGTALVKFEDSSYRISKAKLSLLSPPEGISIKEVAKSNEGLQLTLACDAAKVKPGLKGNLLVSASISAKKKDASSKANLTRTLPAIPFVITRN